MNQATCKAAARKYKLTQLHCKQSCSYRISGAVSQQQHLKADAERVPQSIHALSRQFSNCVGIHDTNARCQETEPVVQQPQPGFPAAASTAAAPAGPASCARLTGSGWLPHVASAPAPSQQPPALLLPVTIHL